MERRQLLYNCVSGSLHGYRSMRLQIRVSFGEFVSIRVDWWFMAAGSANQFVADKCHLFAVGRPGGDINRALAAK